MSSSSEDDLSDEQLVERCRQELPYATRSFEILLRRHEPTVYRTCVKYLSNESDAEEASQDAFLRVYHNLKKFSGKSTFRTWLFRIVSNVCATTYAKRQKQQQQRQAYAQQVRDSGEPVEPPPDSSEIRGPLGDALDALAHEDRQTLILRHVSDLSVPEIAEALDLKLSAAKMRVSRAEQRLREEYLTQINAENEGKETEKPVDEKDIQKILKQL